jgi:hypothetical protein
MINLIKKISVLSIVLGAGVSNAGPCDGLSMSAQPANIDMGIANNVPQYITVSRTSTSGSCTFVLFVENPPGNTDSARYLVWGSHTPSVSIQFYNGTTGAVVKSNAGASTIADGINGTLTGTSMVVSYKPVVNSNGASSGTYTERFPISLYSVTGNFNNRAKITQDNGSLFQYKVDDSISLSLVDTGSPYSAIDTLQDINFGSLTTGPGGQSGNFDLWLMYNSGYKLWLTSTNSGNLLNSAVTSNNTIPYSLSFDGANVTLSSVETMVKSLSTGTSGSTGTKIHVVATVGTVGNVYSGTYSDKVTFRISAP